MAFYKLIDKHLKDQKMNIEDFTPVMVLTQARAVPNPLITLIFGDNKEPLDFYSRFVLNSELRLNITKSPQGIYRLNFIFPKQDNYSISFDISESENSTYEEIFDKNISVTCGFKLPDGKIAGLTPYPLDNKISLN